MKIASILAAALAALSLEKIHAVDSIRSIVENREASSETTAEKQTLKGRKLGYGNPSPSRPGYPSPSRPGGVLTPEQIRLFRERCGCQGALEDNDSSGKGKGKGGKGKGGKGKKGSSSYEDQCQCSDGAELAVLVLFSQKDIVYGVEGYSMEGAGFLMYYQDALEFDYQPFMGGGQHGSGSVGYPTCGYEVFYKESSTCDYSSDDAPDAPCSSSMIFRFMDDDDEPDECNCVLEEETFESLGPMAQENADASDAEQGLGFLRENWAAQLTATGSLGHGSDLILTGATGEFWRASGQPGFMLHVSPGAGGSIPENVALSIWVLPLSDAAACLVNTIITGPPGEPTRPPTPAPTRAPVTPAPTSEPTPAPTPPPTISETAEPTDAPTRAPVTRAPTSEPTSEPTTVPTLEPIIETEAPTSEPTAEPTSAPTPDNCLVGTTREDYLQGRLTAAGVPNILDLSTPQGQAFDWMVDTDDATDPCGGNIEQRFALATFYYSTNGVGWTRSDDWLTAASECTWFGIECSADAVTKIELAGNNLGGALPDELVLMPSVEVLELYSNSIEGTIPSVLSGGWTMLRDLNLEVNLLTGPAVIDTTQMPNLQFYLVSDNQLTGTIPVNLSTNTMLGNLWVARTEITGTLPVELGLLTNMVSLFVYGCDMVGTLPSELGAMTSLSNFQAYENSFSGTIPNELTDLTDLTTLRLDNNFFTGSIPSAIGNLVLLADLRLNNNLLTGTVPSEIGSLTSIQTFRVNNNTLTGTIPDELDGWPDIDFFDVSFNEFNGPLPDSLFTPAKGLLRIAYFEHNQFTGTLSGAYANSPMLRDLYINDNQLLGSVPPIAPGALLNLNEFLLQENEFTGSMPASVCALRSERMLDDLYADCGGAPPEIMCSFPDCCNRCFPEE